MYPEGWTWAQGLPTVRGSSPTVTFLMQKKGCSLREAFPTLITFVALPYIVNSLMKEEGRDLSEGFSTMTTFIRFLCSMGILMKFKREALTEGFPTVITL